MGAGDGLYKFIDGDHLRFAMLANGFAEEAKGRCGIPFSRQQKVDGLTFCIDRPVQIFPLSPDSDVSFIHSLPASYGTFMPTKCLIQQRYQRTH